MYIHIGKDIILKNNDIIGMFNIDYVKNTKEYKGLVEKMKENNILVNISENDPKSLIIATKDKKLKGYLTNISTSTIKKRSI